MHGEGTFTNSKGKSRRGIWEEGKRKEWLKTDNKALSRRSMVEMNESFELGSV